LGLRNVSLNAIGKWDNEQGITPIIEKEAFLDFFIILFIRG